MMKQNSSFTKMSMTLTYLPCVIGDLSVKHSGSGVCAAEQSKAPSKKSTPYLPKGVKGNK